MGFTLIMFLMLLIGVAVAFLGIYNNQNNVKKNRSIFFIFSIVVYFIVILIVTIWVFKDIDIKSRNYT